MKRRKPLFSLVSLEIYRILRGTMQNERMTARSLDQSTTTADFYDDFVTKVSTSPTWPASSEQVSISPSLPLSFQSE